MSSFDRQLFFAINHGLKNGLNDTWLAYATWLGNGWFAFPIAILLLIFLDQKQWRVNVLTLAIAGVVGGIALAIVKNGLHTPRPLEVYRADIAAGRVYINVMFEPLYANSFPSGHTQTIWSVSTVVAWAGLRAKKINAIGIAALLFVAITVSISRVYCGAHFPSDVLAGAGLGVVTAAGCCVAVGRFEQKKKLA